MVFVSVGEYKPAEIIFVSQNIGEIGYYQIHTRHIVFGESHAAVHGDQIFAVLQQGHIHSYSVNTAYGYYL